MTREEEKYTTLDTEQCKWWVNTLFNMAKEKACNSHNFDDAEEIQSAQDKIIKALGQDLAEYVSRGVYEQVRWERDIAIRQLRELGYSLGEKIEPCEDCVSRKAVLDIAKSSKSNWIDNSVLFKRVNELPPVTPQEPITERIEHGTNGNFYKLSISNGKEFEKKPKPGHWIKYDNEYFADGRLTPVTRSIIECSACHTKIADFYGKMYYCPYCGEPKEGE